MLRFLVAVLVCGFAFSARAQNLGHATVTGRLTAEGVRAVIELDRGVTRLSFSQADVDRREDIDVLTPGLAWSGEGDVIVAARAFRRVELLVRPAARERDAKYPAFFRVGAGGVLYPPALKPDAGWSTRLRITTTRGQIRLPAGAPNIDSSLYIGPSAYVTRGAAADLIASPDTPAALREQITANLAVALHVYTTRLHAALPSRPIVVMAQAGDGRGFVGDVTPGPFVSLRFYGSTEDQTNDAYRVARFVAHEVFHFWNGSLVSNADGAPSWLHEGGADYAALLASMEAGALDDAGMREELGAALTRCRQGLQDEHDAAMNDLTFLSMNVRYPCGIVIQWAASLSAERGGGGGFFDVWAHMIAAAQARPSRTFTLADFYAGAGVDANAPPAPIRLITAERGAARWDQLPAALDAIGAEVSAEATPATRRVALIFHLLGQVCGNGDRGFYTEPNRIRLQTNSTCTLIADNSILTSVEGGDIVAPSQATYTAVQARCAARQEVRVVLDGDRAVAIPCRTELAPAPHAYVVNRWR
ncbi:M1 family aminopeptidase [Terricaulis sp.]|uniref:M1 family aminopeptidase n=1 Tax=Terricaulis sp. TaxID=2768686 RepID=UPI0037851FC6